MTNEVYIDQLLDKYLKGDLSLSETRSSLQQESVESADELIELHSAAAKALQRNSILTQVRRIHADFTKVREISAADPNNIPVTTGKKVTPLYVFKWTLRVAAVFLLMLGGWFAYVYSTTNSTALYSEMYEPYNVNTSRNLVTDIIPHNMVQEYKDKHYKEVITIYRNIKSATNRERFLTAMAYHETGQYKEAIDLFTQILTSNKQTRSRLYQDEAEFFMALSYLKLKDNEAAFYWLRRIYKDSAHTFHNKVSKWTLTRLKWIR